MIKFGLIGAGTLGQAHADTIQRLPNTQLMAVVDPNMDHAQHLAKKFEADSHADFHSLIEREDIDAVVIASPTPHHFEQAKSAIEAGKHTFIEMPVVRHLREANDLQSAAAHSQLVITIGHTLRGYPEYRKMKQSVEDGSVGKPCVIRLSRRTPHPRRWYSNYDESGGVVLDSMVHEFDYLQWCFGPVERIYSKGMQGRRDTDKLDYALALVRLKSGAIAHIESSWCHYGQFLLDVEIAGDNGLINYSNLDSVPLHLSALDLENSSRQYAFESPVAEPAHYKLFSEFVQAIEGKAENPVTLADGIEAVRLAHTCLKSIESNRPEAPLKGEEEN